MKQTTTVIAGLRVHTYTNDEFATSSTKPIFAIFVLHGRMGSMDDMQNLTSAMLAASTEKKGKDLMVVMFDHRNHGTRLVDKAFNSDFETNPNHALDMYGVQLGTARDVSFVIDFLPSYLFPLGQRTIDSWGISGVSLGGHSTWIAGAFDPRVSGHIEQISNHLKQPYQLKLVIPIIGCPDYLALMRIRAEAQGVAIAPPNFPASFIRTVEETALTAMQFEGKRLLVLSGGSDTLPWAATAKFVAGLHLDEGQKEIVVYPGVGHQVPDEMVKRAVAFTMSELE
ncbi:Alpha/Beta hydrolase protein [Mycena amicta]|nr:Alpha/Beta hydrolase protein [Mycena amicta]